MTWRNQLQPASFRGVPFLVDSDTMDGGRRGPTHEYPYKEEPYNEDMGLKARTYKFAAYVIGDDYFGKRDALIDALETKGPDTLIHPQYGAQQVRLLTYSVNHSTEKGREARFELVFKQEDERSQYPSSTSNTLAKTAAAQAASQTQASSEAAAALGGRF